MKNRKDELDTRLQAMIGEINQQIAAPATQVPERINFSGGADQGNERCPVEIIRELSGTLNS